VKLHLGYAAATIGYMIAILALNAPSREAATWPALAAVAVQVPLFAGLAACTLLCLTDGEWRRTVSWRLYTLVVAVIGGYAGLAEWYATMSGRATGLWDFLVSVAGVIGLLLVHWLAGRQGMA
jgi:hypothetical protein